MIAAVAVYAVVLGLVVGVFSVLFERGVRALQGPTRFVWAAAMVAMVFLPATALVPRAPSTPAAQAVATLNAVRAPEDMANEIPTKDSGAIAASSASESLANRLRERLDRIRDNTAPYDGVLLAIWAVASAFFLGVLLHAMSEVRRMRTGLQSAVVGGTAVLVSEDIGPSAVGGNPAAIVMPRWAMALDESLRSLVIRHEQEHLTSRDPTLLTIVLCLLVLMPWHPVLWWSWRRLRLAIEIDCDARVLRFQPNPKVYGQLLLLVSHHRSRIPRGQRVTMSLAAPLSPWASQLKQRIDAMTTRPTPHKRSMIAALTAGMVGACILIAAVPTPRTKAVYRAGSPLEYRWVTPQGAADGVLVLPRRTEGDSSTVTVTEPFLTLADVDSIFVSETDYGEAVAGAVVRADARDKLRATTRQRAGSEVAVVVEGVVISVATATSELGGPLPIWTGATDEALALAERLRESQRNELEVKLNSPTRR
ncbi:M56 family metallopeptidase [Gemmatimonas sp. UBA7669]|uniref:M56 family metallopeptidase n=1 Tax=Gemmatimonas sp. UBA7669 TaxID=1946568 RepID=UPI0025C63944|nr:M56 family metallopeptidase [Gemmatimonas sp. UBA7669]